MRAHVCLSILILTGIVGFSGGTPVPKAATRPSSGQETSTLDDQIDLAVTVYNSDIALVRDVRQHQASRAAASTSASWTSPRP